MYIYNKENIFNSQIFFLSAAFVGLNLNSIHASSILEEAENCLKQIASREYYSSYNHENKITDTVYRFNCYGFINFLINQVSPSAHQTLRQRMIQMESQVPLSYDGMPCPFNFFAIFQSLKYQPEEEWFPIVIPEIQPGDILVYQPLNYAAPKEPDFNKPSGTHVMIIQEVVNSTPYLHLRIIDSTRRYHNKSDTRYPNNSGIGSSDLFIRHHPITNNYSIRWHHKERWLEKELSVGRLKGAVKMGPLDRSITNCHSVSIAPTAVAM